MPSVEELDALDAPGAVAEEAPRPRRITIQTLDSLDEPPGFFAKAAKAAGTVFEAAVPNPAALLTEAARIPKPAIAPTIPSQAEVREQPPAFFEGVTGAEALGQREPIPVTIAGPPAPITETETPAPTAELRAAPPEQPSLIQRGLQAAGVLDLQATAARRAAQERARGALELEAQRAGVTPEAFRQPGPRVIEQAAGGFAQGFTGGIGGAISNAYGFSETPPETVAQQLARGGGHLAGFILGLPVATGKKAVELTIGKYLQPLATDSTRRVLAKSVAEQTAVLSAATVVAGAGEAAGQQSVLDAAKSAGEAAKQGALLGLIFGGAGGLIPGDSLAAMATRLGVGMAAIDAVQGQHPLDDRVLAQKAFDYGLNAFFLFRGRDPAAVLKQVRARAKAEGLTEDEAFRRFHREITAAAMKPEVPAPAEVVPKAPVLPSAPTAPVVELRPTGGPIPTPERIPATFREYVVAQKGATAWPLRVTDPDFLRLRTEYDALRAPLYEKRGAEVVNKVTNEVVATLPNGAAAQLEANRLNGARLRPVTAPVTAAPAPVVRPAPAPEVPSQAPPAPVAAPLEMPRAAGAPAQPLPETAIPGRIAPTTEAVPPEKPVQIIPAAQDREQLPALSRDELTDLVRIAAQATDDPTKQRQLVEAYLAGHSGMLPPRVGDRVRAASQNAEAAVTRVEALAQRAGELPSGPPTEAVPIRLVGLSRDGASLRLEFEPGSVPPLGEIRQQYPTASVFTSRSTIRPDIPIVRVEFFDADGHVDPVAAKAFEDSLGGGFFEVVPPQRPGEPPPLMHRSTPAVFAGMQERPDKPPLVLYTLTEDIPGHPDGSTVSAETLRKAGFEPPEPKVPDGRLFGRLAVQQPDESLAAWNARWFAAAESSWRLDVRIPNTPFRLIDSRGEREVEVLRGLAEKARYLEGLGRWTEKAMKDVQARLGPDWPQAEFAGFDTGFDDLGVHVAGNLLQQERNQILLFPWRILELAKLKQGLDPSVGLSQHFADQVTETFVHELAHQRTLQEGEAHRAEMHRIETQADAQLRTFSILVQTWMQEATTHDRFEADRATLFQFRRSGPPAAGTGRVGAEPDVRHEGTPLLGRALEGQRSRPVGGGKTAGARPETSVGRGGEVPPIISPPTGTPVDVRGGPTVGAERRTEEARVFDRADIARIGLDQDLKIARQEAGPPGEKPPPPGREPEEIRPDVFRRLVEVGGAHYEEGAREFLAWSERMKADLGDPIEPHLSRIWEELQRERTRAATPEGEFVAPQGPLEPPALEEPRLTLGRHKEVVAAATEVLVNRQVERDKSMLLSDQILDMMQRGQLPLEELLPVLDRHSLTLGDFGEQMFRPAIADAGRRLQVLSVLERRLNTLAQEAAKGKPGERTPEEIERLLRLAREMDEGVRLQSWWRRADNVRRGMLVTQLATAVRNYVTQVGRLGLDVADAAMQASLQRAFGREVTAHPADAMRALTEAIANLNPRNSAAQRAKIDDLLKRWPRQWDRLFGTYLTEIQAPREHPITGAGDRLLTKAEKTVAILNTANRFQEYAVRMPVFWTTLDGLLRTRGLDLERLIRENKFGKIKEGEIKAAIEKALDLTYARNPRVTAPTGRPLDKFDNVGRNLIGLVNSAPFLFTAAMPFPRFLFNSIRFLYEFSPLGYLQLISPIERAAIRSGDFRAVSRATLGSAMLLAAYGMRVLAGDETQWYELPIGGGRTIDLRPYNPFAAYLYGAELIRRWHTGTFYEKFGWKDLAQGILSANVRGGAGLFVLDKILDGLRATGTTGKAGEAFQKFAGEVLSGYLVPLQQIKDLIGQFDERFRTVHATREQPFVGPFKEKIPGAAEGLIPGVEGLEPAYQPTRAEPRMREQPLLRQVSGLIVNKPKNAAERELTRFQFNLREIQPSVGDPKADNLVAQYMGELVESRLVPYVESDRYQRLPPAAQANQLRLRLKPIRAMAKARARREEPELFKGLREERRPGRERLFREERQQLRKSERAAEPVAVGAGEEEE